MDLRTSALSRRFLCSASSTVIFSPDLILKRRSVVAEKIEEEEEDINTTRQRRVSFASSNFIKPFTADAEKNTIWDTTIEETANHTDSTHSSQDTNFNTHFNTTMHLTCEEMELTKCNVVQFVSNTSRNDFYPQSFSKKPVTADMLKENENMEMTCQFSSVKSIIINESSERNVKLSQPLVDVNRRPKSLVADMKEIIKNSSYVQNKTTHDDMEFTCQFPAVNNPIMANHQPQNNFKTPHIIEEKSQNNTLSDGMEFTCQFPSSGKIFTTQQSQRNLEFKVPFAEKIIAPCNAPVNTSEAMELTCQFPTVNKISTDKENVVISQDNVENMHKTISDMDLTCQFSKVNKISIIDKENIPIFQDMAANETVSDGMEFTCQFPNVNKIISNPKGQQFLNSNQIIPSTMKNALISQENVKNMNTTTCEDMELTNQFPNIGKAISDTKENAIYQNNVPYAPFTCQFSVNQIISNAKRTAFITPDSVPTATEDMEFTCQFPSANKIISNAEIASNFQKINETTTHSKDMEFTCQFPQNKAANEGVSKDASNSKEMINNDDKTDPEDMEFTRISENNEQAMEFTCQFPTANKIISSAEIPLDSQKINNVTTTDLNDMEFTRVEDDAIISGNNGQPETTSMEFTCQFPNTHEIISSAKKTPAESTNVTISEDMELTRQFPNVDKTLTHNSLINEDIKDLSAVIPTMLKQAQRNISIGLNESSVPNKIDVTRTGDKTYGADISLGPIVINQHLQKTLMDTDMMISCPNINEATLPTNDVSVPQENLTEIDLPEANASEIISLKSNALDTSKKSGLPTSVEKNEERVVNFSPIKLRDSTAVSEMAKTFTVTPGVKNSTYVVKNDANEAHNSQIPDSFNDGTLVLKKPDPSDKIVYSCKIPSHPKPSSVKTPDDSIRNFFPDMNTPSTSVVITDAMSPCLDDTHQLINATTSSKLDKLLSGPNKKKVVDPRFINDTLIIKGLNHDDIKGFESSDNSFKYLEDISAASLIETSLSEDELSIPESNFNELELLADEDEFIIDPIFGDMLNCKLFEDNWPNVDDDGIEEKYRAYDFNRNLEVLKRHAEVDLEIKRYCNIIEQRLATLKPKIYVPDFPPHVEQDVSTDVETESEEIVKSMKDRILEAQERCEKKWKIVELTNGFCKVTTMKVLDVNIKFNSVNLVTEVFTQSYLQDLPNTDPEDDQNEECQLIVKQFENRLSPQILSSCLGGKYDILTLLDYIQITCQKLNKFHIWKRMEIFLHAERNFIMLYKVLNFDLMVKWYIRIDMKDMWNITEDCIVIEDGSKNANKREIIKIALACPKGFNFLNEFIDRLHEHLSHLIVKQK